MNRLIARILLAGTALVMGAQAQSTIKANFLSESFSKAALRVVISLHDSDGTRAGKEHIKTLFEDLEIEQATPAETAIIQNLRLWSVVHDSNVNTFNTWMTFTSCVKDVNDPSPEPARIPCPDVVGTANKESGIQKDFACFDAYKTSLKEKASTIPEPCSSEKAIVGTKEQQEERKLRDACLAGKTRPDEIAACYRSEKK